MPIPAPAAPVVPAFLLALLCPALAPATPDDDPDRNGRPRTTGTAGEATPGLLDASSPGLVPDDFDDDPGELRGAIERFSADLGSLRRSAPPDESPDRGALFDAFHRGWLDRLAEVDFDALGPDATLDHVLFRNHLEREIRAIDRRCRERDEAAPLVPFGRTILDLDRSRRLVEPMDWAEVAGRLDRLAAEIEGAAEALDDLPEGDDAPGPRVASRASAIAGDLRETLRRWFAFYDGYDPIFSWWIRQPYSAADEALDAFETSLRDRFKLPSRGRRGGNGNDDDNGEIVGTPIGREALLDELASEMIPYSPEELIELAEAELSWCEEQMTAASRDLGFGDDWRAALEHVKGLHVPPGDQPRLIRDLAVEAIAYLDEHDLVTVPPLCRDSWRIAMMSPDRQLVNPFFTGGETISVSFPTADMPHEAKLMSMRGNNEHFSRATVHHELIPGHHLQGFMTARYKAHRRPFATPFWGEGWALYWELLLWDRDFARSAEDRVGMLFWRMHRCARIIFSLGFHLDELAPAECVDLLVDRVGHERANAEAEVRRSVGTSYAPLYQAAYLLGGLQLRALHRELVESGEMSDRDFHDAVLRQNSIPIELLRARLTGLDLRPDHEPSWRFYDPPASDD